MRPIEQVELIHRVSNGVSPEVAKILEYAIQLHDKNRDDLIIAVTEAIEQGIALAELERDEFPEIIDA